MLSLNTFPMAPAGGLFIAVMGCCVALGGPLGRHRKALLIIGAVLGTGALVAIGPVLQTGRPTSLQVAFLIGSIALEGVLVRMAFVLNHRRDERRLMSSVLLAVGLHFLPMAVAFGPLCLSLSAACVANALVGLRLSSRPTLARLWSLDGVLKIVIGSAMMASPVVSDADQSGASLAHAAPRAIVGAAPEVASAARVKLISESNLSAGSVHEPSVEPDCYVKVPRSSHRSSLKADISIRLDVHRGIGREANP